MARLIEGTTVELVRRAAHRLRGAPADYDPLLDLIGDARLVLLGEGSHGTHEFYRARAELTRRLIVEKGFNAVAVEADWPDAYRVNRYVRGYPGDGAAAEALGDFRRFPTWMWRNADVLDFVGWLRERNDGVGAAERAGFYGLDLYSLYTSIGSVVAYLDKVDPEAARRARTRYACLEEFGQDSQAYGHATAYLGAEPCEDDVVAQLVELQRRAAELASRDGRIAEDEFFSAQQNARLAVDAEAYYRAMFRGRVSSWNLRDRHMARTLDELIGFISRPYGPARVVVWEHNSHLGDARATEMGARGELNVGQLVREQHGRGAVLVGFSTHHGTVTAADDWDEPAERKRVREALPGSYEALFHEAGVDRFALTLRDGDAEPALRQELRRPRLERAIGVIYRPRTERASHYFEARLADQFDAIMHFDGSRAVEPLEPTPGWHRGAVPETYPTAL
jgi:erythromycin esterase-like protein